jgi:hypothetical protein
MTMRFPLWMRRVRPAGIALLVTALSALAFGSAAAQRRSDQSGDVMVDALGAPGGDFNASQARRARGFRLFGGADAAGVGLHGTGNFAYALDNYSPCDAPLSGFCSWNVFAARGGGVVTFQFFEVLFAAGVPASEWAKARRLAPSLANASGGGYSYINNYGLFSGRSEWGPRDNTLARLFSGVASTDDGSCRDNTGFSNGYYPAGLPLLAASNCPDTWPGGVWGGDREIAQEGWKTLFDAQGDAFRWDYWQVPDSLKKEGMFAGTNFSTYGETSDHWADILPGYGSAIPGGSGDPSIGGWPLGLVWRFEAFNFGVPTLASVAFFRATVINRSEDVYGVGLDYDSLYLGFQPGTGGSTAAGGQRFSNFYLPSISTAIYHQSYMIPGGPCTQSARRPPGVSVCSSVPRPNMENGGNAIIVLKSPIGDLRNKLFTRSAGGGACTVGVDPFCNPNHPLRGDTITFNHGHQCGFGSCWATTHNVSDKRSVGMISSNAALALDGRDPAALTTGEAWLIFRNKLYPTQRGVFNSYVPGTQGPPAAVWDYTANGTGSPDTLWYDSCADQGCVVTSADTMPGGQINAYGNVGGIVAAGPFPLAAGDSTSWYVALVGDADSARTWASINAAIDLYMNFFLSPVAPPPVSVASTQLTAATLNVGGGRNQQEQVRFFFDEAPEQWVDPFLLKLSQDVQTNPAFAELLSLNPELPTMLADRAADNLEAIEIYKSCDGGNTWTASPDCVGDPATDETGAAAGLGWRAWAIYDVDANNGDVPNVFTDATVRGGQRYMYTIVGKSRGAKFLLNTSSGPAEIEFAPSIRNVLSRSSSDPNVVAVYVPASRPAGYQPASLTYLASGRATVPFSIAVSDEPTAGDYTVVFGNRITVERDSLISAAAVAGTRVIAARVVNAAPGGTPTVVRSETFFRDGADVLPVAGAPSSSSSATTGDTVRTTDVYNALGFVVVAGTTPVFASRTLTGDAATPTAVFALGDFPGFTVSANNALATQFNAAGEQAFRGALTREEQKVSDTSVTIPRGDVDRFMAQWRETNSTAGAYGIGRYVIEWAGDAFGTPRGLSALGPGTEQELQTALAGRPVAATGLTDAATAALLDSALSAFSGLTQQDLVAVSLPFTVRNTTYGRDVGIAMLRRTLTQALNVANTYKLGRTRDTLRVVIQDNQWVPGDVLYFIENVTQDSMSGANVVLDGSGQPIEITRPEVTFTAAVIGCNTPNPPYCNPLGAGVVGATGWLATNAGDSAQFDYYVGFDPRDRWTFNLTPPVVGDDITSVTEEQLAGIRVVPNPFVVFSRYQTAIGDARILWTNVPPTGAIRVYTVAGQFVQQITWNADDLTGTGDLAWNLKSREDIDVASGLYIWVLTAPSDPTNAQSAPVTARGKFVVIRGEPR